MSSKEEGRKRLEADVDDDEIHRPANGNNKRETHITARHVVILTADEASH